MKYDHVRMIGFSRPVKKMNGYAFQHVVFQGERKGLFWQTFIPYYLN